MNNVGFVEPFGLSASSAFGLFGNSLISWLQETSVNKKARNTPGKNRTHFTAI
jgi:hypothetical protein